MRICVLTFRARRIITFSTPAHSIWAKSKRSGDLGNPYAGPVSHWLPLTQHLDDSAEIAVQLWDNGFWPHSLRTRLAEACGGNEGTARAVVELLAAMHDVGKASPAFVIQVPELAVFAQQAGLLVSQQLSQDPDRSLVRHEIVTYLAFKRWLEHRFGAQRRGHPAIALATVLGVHHGRPLIPSHAQSAASQPHLSGDEHWQRLQQELIDWAVNRPRVAAEFEAICAVQWAQHDLVSLAGMTVVADWLASNEEYFPLFDVTDRAGESAIARAREAWRRYDPPTNWQAHADDDDAELMRERFSFPEGSELFATQLAFTDMARRTTRPSLLILEAPMGSGKTEAALAAAEILADRFGLGGLFVALPTQATADAMWGRVRGWADRAGFGTSVFLAHGRAALNDEYDRLTREAAFVSIDDGAGSARERTTGSVVAHQWFQGSKKGPLAALVVGTIDQVLFAALRSRHLALRHLAVAGKVVVIDEVHAVDAYMGTFLDRAIEWLGAYQVPVLLLSATLPAHRRRALLEVYERGRRSVGIDAALEGSAGSVEGDIGYPLVLNSADPGGYAVPPVSGFAREISLEWLEDDLACLASELRERLVDGGTAVVIRNTVARAQAAAAYLSEHLDSAEVTLMHARFLAGDRARAERELLRRFGRDGTHRPHRAVVVATQVLEQSLDVDFDVMVTDLAPVDLVLQRAGRLHRHERPSNARPLPVRDPVLLVTGVDPVPEPPEVDGGSAYVYGEHLLWRTFAELQHRDRIVLPGDIAPLVQRVYGDEPYAECAWGESLIEAARAHEREFEAHRDEANQYLLPRVRQRSNLLDWPENTVLGRVEDEQKGRATVRRTADTLEVLALFEMEGEVALSTPPWWPESEQVPLSGVPSWGLVRQVQRTVLRLPHLLCQRYGTDYLIGDVEKLLWKYTSLQVLQNSKLLQGELVLVFDVNGVCQLAPGKPTLRYDEQNGLQIDYPAEG